MIIKYYITRGVIWLGSVLYQCVSVQVDRVQLHVAISSQVVISSTTGLSNLSPLTSWSLGETTKTIVHITTR